MSTKPFELDEFDKRILYELDRDSSLPLSKLARAVKKSKQFTLFRLKRFEREGVITHYTAIVDMARMGNFTFRFYVRLRQSTRGDLEKIVQDLKAQENIWTIAICHGKWDLAFFVGTKRIEDVHKAWDNFRLKYRRHIESYNFCLYSPIYNFNRTFFMEGDADVITRVYGSSERAEVDETDLKIIQEYAPNVRRSTLQLAKKLGLSPETVARRIKRLEKQKVICGYKIGLDIERLGCLSARIDLDLLSTAREAEMLEYCKQHRAVYQVNKTIGGADFEIELIVRDLNELLGIMDDIRCASPTW